YILLTENKIITNLKHVHLFTKQARQTPNHGQLPQAHRPPLLRHKAALTVGSITVLAGLGIAAPIAGSTPTISISPAFTPFFIKKWGELTGTYGLCGRDGPARFRR